MTRVTILDEDFPGTIGFAATEIKILNSQKEVEIEITRENGSDGIIECKIHTEPLTKNPSPTSAQEYEDFIPKNETITFGHNEQTAKFIVQIVTEKKQIMEAINETNKIAKVDDDAGDAEE